MAPKAIVRLLNRLMAARVARRAAQPMPEQGYALRVLEVPGRRSGRTRRTPIGVLAHAGGWFAVCPDARRDWPANLRAAGACALVSRDRRQVCRAVEVRDSAAAEIVAAYLHAAGNMPWVSKAFGIGPDPEVTQIPPRLHRMAVFELSPRGHGRSSSASQDMTDRG